MATCETCGGNLGGRWGTRCYTCSPPPLRTGRRTDERIVRSDGYVLIWAPDHPTARNGRMLEHRLVAERALGRALERWEHVHHLNHVRSDNREENLQVVDMRDHPHLHPQRRDRITRECEWCGATYERKRNRADETRFCSASCRSKAVSCRRWHAGVNCDCKKER